MANEAVCIELPSKYARYVVADGDAIPKGTLLKISADPNTAALSAGSADVFAGIAIEEKVASDGKTQIGAAIDGVWDLKVCPMTAVTLGAMVVISGANMIRGAIAADLLTGATFGKALETGDASEVIRVRLGLN